jgi:hypothetical protein
MTPSERRDFFAFMAEYATESDRAAGVLVGTLLDEALSALLMCDFVDSKDLDKCVFSDDRLLGSLSAKIDFAFFRGHLTTSIRRNLHLLRKIRNHCAHRRTASFSKSPIRDLASELIAAKSGPGLQTDFPGLSIPRIQVLMAAFMSAALIRARASKLSNTKPRIPATIREAFGGADTA